MRKQLAVFLAIILIGAMGFLSLPIGGVTINISTGYLSVSTNVALAVNTLPPKIPIVQSYSPTIIDIQVNASSDDGYELQSTGAMDIAGTTVYHRSGTSPVPLWGAHRWEVSIPKNATIGTAYISLYLYSTSYDDANINLYFQLAASPTTLTTDAYNITNTTNRTRTVANVSWVQDNVTGGVVGWYNSPSLAAPLQELVNTTAVTAIVLIALPNANVSKTLRSYCYDTSGNSTYGAKLYVTYITPPTVTTQAASEVLVTKATGNGNITATGGENCDKRGVCWNTIGSPTVADNITEETGSFDTGTFNELITGLTAGTKYYVRAYAHNSAGYSYGAEVNFTTLIQTFFPLEPIEVVLTTANNWTDVDLDDYTSGLGADVTGVILCCADVGGGNPAFGLRKNGSTDNRTATVYYYSLFWAAIGVDSNHIFEVYVGNTTTIDIYIAGYTETGVVFLTSAIDKSLTVANAWTDIDCTFETYDAAIGLIFEVVGNQTEYKFGLRNNGSSDNRTNDVQVHNDFGWIVGCDSGSVCEGYIGNTSVDLYLVGYITAGATFYTNATDLSLSVDRSWTDLSTLPSDAAMGFIEITTTDGIEYPYGLRRNGSSKEIYNYACIHPSAFVGCDSNNIIEGKILNVNTDFWLVGYAVGEPSVSVIPTVTNGVGATNVTTTTARLNGNLTNDGGENCTVHIYWGTSDGVTNSSNWTNNENKGVLANGTFYTDISNLTLNTTYYYRCYANNSAGSDWADSTANFTTLKVDITNTPASWDFGTVWENSTYSTGLTAFNVTNTGDVPVNISISGTNMTGVGTWTLNDTATPGADTYGLKAGVVGGDYTIIVKKEPTYNNLVTNLGVGNSTQWGLELYTPTSYSGGYEKSGVVTLTATEAS